MDSGPRTTSTATPLTATASAVGEALAGGAPVKAADKSSDKTGYPFRADLDLAELDERGRPGPMWTGRACEIGRSHVCFKSRRLCYEGRELLLAVHLVDDRPVPLCGIVVGSDYDGDGLYRTRLTLIPIPDRDAVKAWVQPQNHRL